MNELLKKIIKNAFQEDFEKMQNELIESLNLKDMSDDELINKFKHTKWKEANNFEKCYLKSRYGFIESFYRFKIASFEVDDDDYISDLIKKILVYNSNLKKLADIKKQKTTKRTTKETKRK